MDNFKNNLINKVKNKTAKVGVIGLGYIGLPLAVAAGTSGYITIGFDVEIEIIKTINQKLKNKNGILANEINKLVDSKALFATNDFSLLKELDIICICVPTPLDNYQQPDISHIEMAVEKISDYLHDSKLIILESTTYPGTTEELVKPILEDKSGLICGKDFFLAFSPERIDPGNQEYKITNTPKIVGGIDPVSTEITILFYKNILQTEVYSTSSSRVAEMVKIYENIFRNVNIALVNEMAILCHRMNISIWEVIEAAKTKPYGFMPFYPGPGIGGHCIPLDPFYLTWKAKEYNYHTKFIELAGEINRYMPEYIVERISRILSKKALKPLKKSKILLIGVSYKKDIGDLRESPALLIIKKLEEEGALLTFYDPYIPEIMSNGKKYSSLKKLSPKQIFEKDIIVIITDHSNVNYDTIVENARIIFDTRNVLKVKDSKIEKL